MSTIEIRDLIVCYHVGVPDRERERPQRLSLTVVMETDFVPAAHEEALEKTIDYYAVSERLRDYGIGRSWRLLETLVLELSELILSEFGPRSVSIEIKKFILSDTQYVAVKHHQNALG